MEATRSSSSSTNFPDELVAKIIAMIPFPSIFKARMLSKTWLARFSPIEPLDDGKKQKHRATRSQARESLVCAAAFQKQVLEWSTNWPFFFPFKLGRSDSCAYELTSHTLRSLPSLSFLPKTLRQDFEEITTAGALLFWYDKWKTKELYVANIFTRSFKALPPGPTPEINYDNNPLHAHLLNAHIVTDPSMQNYKVIMLFEEIKSFSESFLHIYNSKSNEWSSKNLGPRTYGGLYVVHLNGVLYWTEGDTEVRRKLVALDSEVGTLTELSLSGPIDELIDGRILSSHELVVCNSSLVMVVHVMIDSVRTRKLIKIDLGSGTLSEIGIGGPALHYRRHMGYNSQFPFGHGDCIYFGFLKSCGGAVTYNLPKDEWSCLDMSPKALFFSHDFWNRTWKPSVFEPGLNLFMPV